MKFWRVYILRCNDGSLYTGITNDLERRVRKHNDGSGGCKYTHSRRPVELVWSCMIDGYSEALKLEARIKKLPRKHKDLIVKDSMSFEDIQLRLNGNSRTL